MVLEVSVSSRVEGTQVGVTHGGTLRSMNGNYSTNYLKLYDTYVKLRTVNLNFLFEGCNYCN